MGIMFNILSTVLFEKKAGNFSKLKIQKKFWQWIVVTTVLVNSPSYAQQFEHEVKSRFVSSSQDAYSFIKSQLIYRAFKEAMTLEMKEMELNSELFWKRYDEKFSVQAQNIKNRLLKKYKVEQISELKGYRLKRFEQDLRYQELKEIAQFGDFSKAISRFAIKRISRSTKDPSIRYLRMNVSVNNQKVHQIYKSFLGETTETTAKTLVFDFDLQLAEGTWIDLGIETPTELQAALSKSWKKWLLKNYNPFIDNVLTIEEATNSESPLEDYQKLHFEIVMKKVDENIYENHKEFQLEAFLKIVGSTNNKLLAHFDVDSQYVNFSSSEGQNLASAAATSLFNFPLKGFLAMKSDLAKSGVDRKLDTVLVKNVQYPSEAWEVKKLIERKGITIGIDAELARYQSGQSQLKLEFVGDRKRIQILLHDIEKSEEVALNNIKLTSSLKVEKVEGEGVLDKSEQKLQIDEDEKSMYEVKDESTDDSSPEAP